MKNLYPAPAKINRFLHIIGQRRDGKHTIHTLFQFLQFEDTLSFSIRKDGKIRRIDNHDFILPEVDLCVQAARQLQQLMRQKYLGVTIHLNKNIPPGSGMGGGSSNAATTLLALNHLWGLNLTNKKLQQIGLSLGTDVPVFVYGHACFASGVGEILTPYNPPESWLCIVIPDVHVSTAEIFSHPQLRRDGVAFSVQHYAEQKTSNYLERITRKLYPEIDQVFDILNNFGSPRMNGSGCSVFLTCKNKKQAEKIKQQLPSNLRVILSKTLNTHARRTTNNLTDKL